MLIEQISSAYVDGPGLERGPGSFASRRSSNLIPSSSFTPEDGYTKFHAARDILCGHIPKGYSFYLWNKDDGYNNMGDWIEEAATAAGQ